MLVINFDIAEGENKGFYMDKYKNSTPRSDSEPIKWQGKYYLMLEGDSWEQRFKGFITSIEESNEGFKWNAEVGDEQTLKGKLFGGLFGEEEYSYNGEIRTNTKLRYVRSTKTIKDGNYEIPKKREISDDERERLNNSLDTTYAPITNDDLPF